MKIIWLIVLLIKYVLCGNILFVSPLASLSHHIWNKVLSMGLIEKGHNITMLSNEYERKVTSNFTVLTMEGFYEVLRKNFNMNEIAEASTLTMIKEIYDYAELVCKHAKNTEGLQTLLNYPKDFEFDMIIYDMTITQCFYPLIERFNYPPVIGVTAFLLPPTLSYTFGNHLHTSHVPFYGFEYTTEMNAVQRFSNFIYAYGEVFYRDYVASPKEFELAKRMFGDDIRSFEEAERNISLLLANTDPVLCHPLALPPNIIPVGGLHIKPAQTLPKDLKKIVDNATHGVILFALGTNIRAADLKHEHIRAFLDAFAKLPQIVLWKFESDTVESLPENVVIRKWLPQNDILGHPNTKLFISHGGALSCQEAMYHGVPTIGIPFFGDQYVNVRQIEERGIGERIDIKETLTTGDIYEKIVKVLSSDEYRNKMRKISMLYKDQPQTALERAIFWVEYVLRHGSAEHLNLVARNMLSYKTSNLDVYVIFILSIILIYSFLELIFKGCRFMLFIYHTTAESRTSK